MGVMGDVDDLLSAAFEATGVGVCFIAADGRLIRFNPAFCRMVGREAEELQGQPWAQVVPPEIAAQHESLLSALLADSPQEVREWRLLRRDGSLLTVQLDAKAISRADGSRCAMLIFTDIEAHTVRQREQAAEFDRTDQALQRSEERYRQVIENVSVGIIVVQDGRFRFANPAALEITGYRPDEIVGLEFVPLIHEADRANVFDRHQRRQRGEEIEPRYEFRIVTPAGRLLWVELAAVMIVWDGAPATLSFVSDITRRKEAEEALRRSEGRYRSVIEGAPVGIVIVRSNRVRLANPRMLDMVGFSREEMLALPSFLECVEPSDRELMANVARRHLQMGSGSQQVVSFRLRSKSSETVWVEGSTVQVEWEGLPATLAFIHDITRQRQLENNLQRALAERETILEASVMGIAFLDAKGRVRWANTAMQQIFALERELPVGESLEPYYPSREEYLRIGAEVSAAVHDGRAYECELQMRRAGGALFWVNLSGRAVNQHDLGQGTVWVVLDINRRKKLADALRRKTAEQDAILQSTQIGITLSVDRHHQWVNRTFADMMGFSEDELLGVSSRIHFPDDVSWNKIGTEAYPVLRRGESYATECQMRRKEGELIWIQLFGKAVGAVLGLGEHHGAAHVERVEEMDEQLRLLRLEDEVERLVDAIDRRRDRRDRHGHGVAQQRVGEMADLLRHGRAEEHRLARLGQKPRDAADRLDEAHVEHAVGLVEDEELDLAEVDQALVEQVDQSARRGDDDVDALLDRADLRALADAAEDHRVTQRRVTAVAREALGDLRRELTSG